LHVNYNSRYAFALRVGMTWNLNGKEFENVVQLPPQKRYEYFIKKVADWREVWSLWNDGWVLMGDKDGGEMVVLRKKSVCT